MYGAAGLVRAHTEVLPRCVHIVVPCSSSTAWVLSLAGSSFGLSRLAGVVQGEPGQLRAECVVCLELGFVSSSVICTCTRVAGMRSNRRCSRWPSLRGKEHLGRGMGRRLAGCRFAPSLPRGPSGGPQRRLARECASLIAQCIRCVFDGCARVSMQLSGGFVAASLRP